MAKKKAKITKTTKQSTPPKTSEKSAVEKKEQNYKVVIGLLVFGVLALLFLLLQSQTTINEQREELAKQQNEIKVLEEKIEKFKNEPLKTILDGAGEQIIEKGTEILEEIISPQE